MKLGSKVVLSTTSATVWEVCIFIIHIYIYHISCDLFSLSFRKRTPDGTHHGASRIPSGAAARGAEKAAQAAKKATIDQSLRIGRYFGMLAPDESIS